MNLSERQWATVREDYSAEGNCWDYFPHDHARSRAYRWGEDGLLGFTDRECRLCFALAVWNGKDPILKERLFGLTGPEGNHGEDVKEQYFYLDATPTCGTASDARRPIALFTENSTNTRRLYSLGPENAFFKDAFHDYVIHGRNGAINPAKSGTKAALHYVLQIAAHSAQKISLRLFDEDECSAEAPDSDAVFATRIREADEYYESVTRVKFSEAELGVARQAAAGLLWSKQFYHYVVADWVAGDPAGPAPPAIRLHGRNKNWTHVYSRDVISMPDKWEYPWFAAWDLAFHRSLVPPPSPRPCRQHQLLRAWSRPPVPLGYSLAPPSGARPELHARRERVPLTVRNSVAIQIPQEGPVHL